MSPEEGEPLGMSGSNAEKAEELFDLHFNRVYDFCLRVLGMPDAAADAAEESFRIALAAPPTAGSFEIRLFSATLDALEPRLKLRHPTAIGSNPLFHQVDVERLADATRAPSAQETAGLIWETMSRLDPADYVLLDLRFRQNLDEKDLATILRTNENAVRMRLSKLLKRTEPELSSLIVGRRGSRNCEGMRRAMLSLPIAATRDKVRKAVEKHIRSCPICTATRAGLASPLLVLAAFSLVEPGSAEGGAAKGRLVAGVAALPPLIATPVVAAAAAAPPPPAPPTPAPTSGVGGAGGLGGGPPKFSIGLGDRWRRFFANLQFSNSLALPIVGAVVVLAAAVAIAFATGLFGGSSGGTTKTPTPAATKTAMPATPSPKPSSTPTASPSPTGEATATPEAATATPTSATHPTATTAATATATQPPVTPSPEATATPEPSHTPHPTHTPQPTETPTP